VRQIWTNEGSKRVVPPKDVPFRGLNDVLHNFRGQAPKKTDILGSVNMTFKPERQKFQIIN